MLQRGNAGPRDIGIDELLRHEKTGRPGAFPRKPFRKAWCRDRPKLAMSVFSAARGGGNLAACPTEALDHAPAGAAVRGEQGALEGMLDLPERMVLATSAVKIRESVAARP